FTHSTFILLFSFLRRHPPLRSTLFPYTTLFRSSQPGILRDRCLARFCARREMGTSAHRRPALDDARLSVGRQSDLGTELSPRPRSEERRVGKECRSRWWAEQ